MLKCGLLGEKLGHSYSPQIHSMLADYEYKLFEKSPEELEDFLKSGEFDGLNVTIPYKKSVMPYCAELSPTAAQIGSVNTIVRRSDGSLYGDNTDAFGFENLIVHNGIEVKGKKALVLGTGGASVTAQAVLKKLGASEVVVISRRGEDNYENIAKHADAEIIANTTPVGMYPNNGKAAVDLTQFPKLSGVLDVVYNPARTALLLQAEKLCIPCAGGLYMLVSQAKRSCELFTGKSIPDSEIDRIEHVLSHQMQNIVIIGMPGSGKTAVSTMLAERLGRKIFDTDTIVSEKAGMTIPEIFAAQGEAGFRKLETEATAEVGKLSGNIISTGGGVVTVADNYEPLHQNGVIVWIERDTNKLARDGRPISLSSDLNELYAARLPLYERFADIKADNNGDINDTVNAIMEMIK
ncbi:MAG: shikimate kinase [Oscillospiraceae bacterium]|nr:shikimate kinase [Oscillospiraceae bacterium]